MPCSVFPAAGSSLTYAEHPFRSSLDGLVFGNATHCPSMAWMATRWSNT